MEFFWYMLFTAALQLPTILGYNLLFGKAKVFHFGPAGVSLAISYALFLTVMAGGSYVLGILCALAVGAVLALLFTWLALKLPQDTFGVMSIAAHLSLIAVVLNWTSLTRGALGVPHIPRVPFLASTERFALVSLAVSVFFFFLYLRIDRGPIGRRISALAEQGWYASSLGIRRFTVYAVLFLLLSVSHVVGGFFYVQYTQLLHPSDFQFPVFVFFVMVVVAGKPGSVIGVTVATFLLIFLKEGLRFIDLPPDLVGPIRLILFGLILYGAVWWRRDALFPKQRSV